MRFLIRFISRNAAGSVETSDRIVEAPQITIGRATDQVLKVRDRRARLEHARIERRNGDFCITTPTLAGVVVNGQSQREARLQSGDVVEVGANIIRVIDAPDGTDFAISFELAADASDSHLEADWSRPAAGIGGWSKRRLSWIGVAVLLVLTLAVPALSLLPGRIAEVSRNSPLPDDSLWLAGPVHSAHSSIAGDCESCHVEAFRRVPDQRCVECHTVDRHVADGVPVIGDIRCASCHREHNEPPQLVNRRQALCADCHSDAPTGTELPAAGDFLDAHPGFRVSLEQPLSAAGDATEWQTVRVALGGSAAADRSNLSFDHVAHLDPAGVAAPDGQRTLGCADCHVPEPGGDGLEPITMDEHCSGCHTLGFDPDDPGRTVPHGDPAQVLTTLVEFYSARLLGGDPADAEQRIRRPGQTLSREDRDRAAAEARAQAMATARDLFERRACTTCHTVTVPDPEAALPWRVEPVRLTGRFLPGARFSHAAHDTGVSECGRCHSAAESTSAADVLIPDIDTCRECHGSGIARRNPGDLIPSTCVMCHDFHFAHQGPVP